MGMPGFPRRTVEDVTADLIEAAGRLSRARAETADIAAALETRWAANRERIFAEKEASTVCELPVAERNPT